ncbi:MAG: preprotein translocase subunit YajC [Lactobacillaceae bacterium]|jgi:preprotein translocase subunit YajC|nr:preprotein translocase subunit YajC [Lactobacillaceae bacterium]
MFISEAFASGGGFSGQDIMATVIQLGLIFVIFYLLLIRPQQVKVKQHNEMLMAIKPGDKIVTGGGIYGKVVKSDGANITVEIAAGVQVVVNRVTIRDVVEEENTKSKTIAKKDSKKK